MVHLMFVPTSAVPFLSVTVAARCSVSPMDVAVSLAGASPTHVAPKLPIVRRVCAPSSPNSWIDVATVPSAAPTATTRATIRAASWTLFVFWIEVRAMITRLAIPGSSHVPGHADRTRMFMAKSLLEKDIQPVRGNQNAAHGQGRPSPAADDQSGDERGAANDHQSASRAQPAASCRPVGGLLWRYILCRDMRGDTGARCVHGRPGLCISKSWDKGEREKQGEAKEGAHNPLILVACC